MTTPAPTPAPPAKSPRLQNPRPGARCSPLSSSSPEQTSDLDPKLIVVPVSLAQANEFVSRHHRHHKPVIGHKFSIGILFGSALRGVAIIGRPVSRHRDDGLTLEVNRCCTDGVANGCSKLYRAAWRAVNALGYRKLITYTLPDEGGASLRGAGFKFVGLNRGGSWNKPSRPRTDKAITARKWLWEIAA